MKRHGLHKHLHKPNPFTQAKTTRRETYPASSTTSGRKRGKPRSSQGQMTAIRLPQHQPQTHLQGQPGVWRRATLPALSATSPFSSSIGSVKPATTSSPLWSGRCASNHPQAARAAAAAEIFAPPLLRITRRGSQATVPHHP